MQSNKKVIPPLKPGGQPTLVFHKQANRIMEIRSKKAKRQVQMVEAGQAPSKGFKPKQLSRVKVAKNRERLPDGRFKPKD